MNLLHMKYAVEVARHGSLSKAAEVLLTAQPNVSRAIKELEADLGITIFHRTQKGMVVTPEGEDFISCARQILKQIDEVEQYYKSGTPGRQRFSVSVPRACYISEALADFSSTLGKTPLDLIYRETNSRETINSVLENEYKLGVIRYAAAYDTYFKSMLEEKGLNYEMITEFSYRLLMSRHHPLANKETILLKDLHPFVEVAQADSYVPAVPLTKLTKEEQVSLTDRRIYVFERASRLDLLSRNQEAFTWVSPISPQVLERYGLVQRPCADNDRVYKDVLIYRRGHALTAMDKRFLTALCDAKRRLF